MLLVLIDFEKHFKTFYNALAIKLKSFRSNWGQNDPNANDYIKDRTHWIDDDGNIHTLDECYIPDTIARTSDVEASFSAKAEAEHTHEIADVTDLQTTLDGKANSEHAHEIADVDGLQSALDGKIGSPATATVGQVISVKTVDANGKPTEWEAVSMLPTVDDSGVLIF